MLASEVSKELLAAAGAAAGVRIDVTPQQISDVLHAFRTGLSTHKNLGAMLGVPPREQAKGSAYKMLPMTLHTLYRAGTFPSPTDPAATLNFIDFEGVDWLPRLAHNCCLRCICCNEILKCNNTRGEVCKARATRESARIHSRRSTLSQILSRTPTRRSTGTTSGGPPSKRR
jgi:hypothetical protein